MLEEGKTRTLVPVSGEADVPGRISHNSNNFSNHTVGGPGAEIMTGQLGARPHNLTKTSEFSILHLYLKLTLLAP